MGAVGANSCCCRPPGSARARTSGALPSATSPLGAITVTCHGTFQRGSSKHGVIRRAYCAWPWENRYERPSTTRRNRPRSGSCSSPEIRPR
ncbi:MAG: hypothetical protein IPI49_00155 [Myxococcales bacterium]|nr:hypothetical protein [Myxococcales bacterium]